MNSLEQLNSRFSIPGLLRFEAGGGGFTRAVISAPHADAHVYLHGAHVTHYQPRKQEPVLFLSSKSFFETGKPIRGGVPICFPFFAAGKQNDPTLPFHGFARIMDWDITAAEKVGDSNLKLTLSLASNEKTRVSWPHEFRATYIVTVGSHLLLDLEVTNTGEKPFEFEEALHTYLQVGDIRQVSVTGLEDTQYVDKTQGMKQFEQGPNPVKFTGETDRIYLDTIGTCIAHDPAARRSIAIAKDASRSTVVWNPWSENAKKAVDLGDDEWIRMLCIETCNVKDESVVLPPGLSHTMKAIIGTGV